MENYYGQHELFSGNSGPQKSAVNVQNSLCFYYFSIQTQFIILLWKQIIMQNNSRFLETFYFWIPCKTM
jgi:hypothetical protein